MGSADCGKQSHHTLSHRLSHMTTGVQSTSIKLHASGMHTSKLSKGRSA